MLHRFKLEGAGTKYGADLHDVNLLESALQWLKKKGYAFISVDDIAQAMQNGKPLPQKSVAFTLDDGYWDQFESSVELFAQYDCPATYYIATGFVEKEVWFWDSKVEYLFAHADAKKIEHIHTYYPVLKMEGACVQQKISKFIASLKFLNYEAIEVSLAQLAQQLEVEIPQQAPQEFAPADWSTIKAAKQKGMVIGAHTHRHPLLSRETEDSVVSEITQSHDIIQSKVGECSKVFCYPVGRAQDFGAREEAIVKRLGYSGAVSAIARCCDVRKQDELYRIPRFGFPGTKEDFIQYATWIEPFKNSIR